MSKINYDLTRIRGIVFDVDGVLSPSTIPMSADGEPMRMVNIKDGYALQLAVKLGLKIAIITGAKIPGITKRYNTLGIKDVVLGASMKLPIFAKWLEDNGLEASEVAYVGDDVPDYEVMKCAGLSVAPRDAAIDIKMIADYITPCDGGHGVARDLIEEVLRAKGQWLSDSAAFGW